MYHDIFVQKYVLKIQECQATSERLNIINNTSEPRMVLFMT